MGLDIEDIFKGNIVTGLAIGIGATMLAPVVGSVLSEVGKPLVKGAMKSGVLLFQKTKEFAAEAGEAAEDLWAEAKAEIEEEMETGELSVQESVEKSPVTPDEQEAG